MPYKQIADVLKAVKTFHQQLAEICEDHSRSTNDERLELLLDIVRRHETQFSSAISRYEDGTHDGVLNTWQQFASTDEILSALQSAQLADANSIAEIAEHVWEFENALIELYRQLAESASAPSVQELFAGLLAQEESKTGKYAWSLEEFQGSAIEGPPAER